ncbi:MAG TPA: FAD-dependent oxidoreductase [Candidatus Latescibacteria bacterium]|nr:FAD-dependent oxidoreductase [Candidatus Latescibacterota bacterium]
MRKFSHKFDFCVVGGGMAGLCAAIAAARKGIPTAIIQDRPIFGGNSSSEIRVHICGADRAGKIPNMRETGILEELRLENLRRNPQRSFSIWDTILYEKVLLEPNLEAFLNCSCLDAEMEGDRIRSVTGWQLTTETYHKIEAEIFADCSGDGILAPLTGAEFRIGREARSEYGESYAPEVADRKTMGMTCLFGARDTGKPQPFEPPCWAYDFPTDDDLPHRVHGHLEMGYWWIELGGEQDSIHDTEKIRDELLKIVFGIWDHLKNHGDHGAETWVLDWIQFLPGKRESRRYIGDHVLTQNDIESEGRFEDIVAYGGWPMDDHHPGGFWHKGEPTTFYPTPSPYGIPYRCLYSKNIANLMFAGRCASCSHMAMSSTRVMGTGAVMGQAVGIATALAVKNGINPREVGRQHLKQLQQELLRDDCYLPWLRQEFSPLTRQAVLQASSGDPEPLRDGINRPVGEELHAWEGKIGESIEYVFSPPQRVSTLTLIFDSALSRYIAMSHLGKYDYPTQVPLEMVRDFRIQILTSEGWRSWREIKGNYQRLVRMDVGLVVSGIRVVFDATWGAERVRLYAFYLD